MMTPEDAKAQAVRSYGLRVKQYAQNGEIPATARPLLEQQQVDLNLTDADAQAIEDRVLKKLQAAESYGFLVKQYARNGEIPRVARPLLERRQSQLKLTATDVQAIEKHVLQQLQTNLRSGSRSAAKSFSAVSDSATSDSANGGATQVAPQERTGTTTAEAPPHDPLDETLTAPESGESLDRLQQYQQEFLQAIHLEFPPGELLRQGLKQSQQHLGLTDAEVESIEAQISDRFRAEQIQYQNHLTQYEQEFSNALALGLPFSESTQDQLAELQRSLQLQGKDVTQLEGQILAQYFARSATPPTELSDSPPTQVQEPDNGYSQTAPTEIPPDDGVSFISMEEMPAAEPIQQADRPNHEASAEPGGLRSDKGVDYSTLQDLLRRQNWQAADQETLRVMLQAAERTEQGWLDPDSLTKFPCTDLRTIDRLWKHYSYGKFGFTAQWHSYPMPKRSRSSAVNNLPSRVVHEQVLEFTKKMGWWTDRLEFLKYYRQLNFNLEAPTGHLPALWFWTVPWWKALQSGGIGSGRGGCSVSDQTIPTFMARLRVCGFE